MTKQNQTAQENEADEFAEDGLDVWAMAGFWTKHGGINRKTLLDREVLSRERPDGYLEFNIADGLPKVADLWAKKFNADPKLEKKTAELKREKDFQTVRKLEIENMIRSGDVVKVEKVRTAIGQVGKAIMDKLASVKREVKVAVPDFSQAHLAIVEECIIQKRNELAEERRKDVQS